MIRLSEIITTFAFELERHEKTCRDEDSILSLIPQHYSLTLFISA